MPSEIAPLTLTDAKTALDAGNASGAGLIAMRVARTAGPGMLAQALHFAGLMDREVGEMKRAALRIRNALLAAPERASCYINLAEQQSMPEAALRLAHRGLRIKSSQAAGWKVMAAAHELLARDDRGKRDFAPALDHSRRALVIEPDFCEAMIGAELERRWLLLVADAGCLIDRATRCLSRATGIPARPIQLLSPFATPEDQLISARAEMEMLPPPAERPPRPRERDSLIHIGYVGSNLRQHAVTPALPEFLSHHDRSQFRTTLYVAPKPDGKAGCRADVAAAAGRIIDLSALSPAQQAARMRYDEVDILVDLDGYLGAPLELLCHNPALTLVNYFGFPGTCGQLHDYIVGDGTLLPRGHERYYGEKIVRLPHSYMPFDTRREIPPTPSRELLGLPAGRFVFLGFHSQNKISGDAFGAWMQCLRECPQSILWMLDHGALAKENLRDSAATHGIDGKRILFAPNQPPEQHLARLAAADLYLDNSWFNAHTTGADMLWRGVPTVTIRGESFASRVGASLLTAAGLPDLIATTAEEQAEIAIALARSPERMERLRSHLRRARAHAPLFDMRSYTRALEAAYSEMARRKREGMEPAEIEILPRAM